MRVTIGRFTGKIEQLPGQDQDQDLDQLGLKSSGR